MTALDGIARLFRMTDEAWRRHANPWSVWTRFAAIPAMILAIWSRVWIGWWALVPVALVILWLFLNPHVFAPATEPSSWTAKGIFGEKLWLQDRTRLPGHDRVLLRWLVIPVLCGAVLLLIGLVQLRIWPTLSGAALIVIAQLWRIDRLGRFYERVNGS